MGLGKWLGLSRTAGQAAGQIGNALVGVSEVFKPNATKRMQAANAAYLAALTQFGQEFQNPPKGRFDRFMDGLNRLPRPALALGTIGLFIYAMVAPHSFLLRMEGLDYVPQPLWWLLGAVVSFYFGAREMSYRRTAARQPQMTAARAAQGAGARPGVAPANAALEEWQTTGGR